MHRQTGPRAGRRRGERAASVPDRLPLAATSPERGRRPARPRTIAAARRERRPRPAALRYESPGACRGGCRGPAIETGAPRCRGVSLRGRPSPPRPGPRRWGVGRRGVGRLGVAPPSLLLVVGQGLPHTRDQARELTTHDAADDEHVDGLVVVDDPGADALDVPPRHAGHLCQRPRRGSACSFTHLRDPHQHGIDSLAFFHQPRPCARA